MRKAIRATVLTLALISPAYAGEIPNFPPTPPTEQQQVQEPQTTVAGIVLSLLLEIF